jgi:hypothetical protein
MAQFFQVAWPVIKPDIMQAFDAFWWLDMRNLQNINDALVSSLLGSRTIVLFPHSLHGETNLESSGKPASSEA